ncbi:glucose-1-phosphate adenylyltransferase subunit GlgD [Enterococcus dongliensis]|uniref:glucose-1-phosphate adenylyltransferase subunit GlgD n=1 Tax=Enterococcus dongliensis TaxID=2559925 RepID=UPI0028901255|nr:glucose-1-phosphate adenylyltransferase subunit GlgD [Enterococcus dongliensis]MDT2639502.1 glucose-1-phosphate adenylyltransferase subunit GlgD [Enterococcus dongliensis]MDT2703418.1 glucose-1-phosphate adenylyltransferase subunit GlgD [Enterococcus dongliensis]
MRANKMCAILGNVYECPELLPLTEKRPLATLPFDCKYRLIDFDLSNAINANIKSVYMIFNQGTTKSVFDHIGGGREWHLDSVDSRHFIHFYQDFLKKKTEGRPYFESIIDYLNKSKSEYTVFMGNRMLCNIDLEAVLKSHQQSDSTITVVYKKMPKEQIYRQDEILEVDEQGIVQGHHNFLEDKSEDTLFNLGMKIFICSTEWLINALQEGQNLGSPVALLDFLNLAMGKVKTSAYEYTGFLRNIFDIKSYYDANMAMLDPQKFSALLYAKQKIYTKLKNEVATYYSPISEVKNSQFATGCLVDGKASDSLFSRSVVIEKEAVVEGSIIMANCRIGEQAVIKYAILDKNVVVEPGIKIIGSADRPIVIKKNMHVLNDVYGGE